MAKVKTNKTAKKRFRVTPRGKVLHRKRGWNHLRSKKSKKVRFRKRRKAKLGSPLGAKVKSMMKERR